MLEIICPHTVLPFDNPSAEMEWHEWQCVLKYTEMGNNRIQSDAFRKMSTI